MSDVFLLGINLSNIETKLCALVLAPAHLSKPARTALFGMHYSMGAKRLYALLYEHMREPLPDEVSRWEDDGGAV